MNIRQAERRIQPDPHAPATGSASEIIRNSLLVQHRTGTVSAIEYLKSKAIKAGVIQRVLGGERMRAEDRRSIDALRGGE